MDKRKKKEEDKSLPVKVYLKKKNLYKIEKLKFKKKMSRSSIINQIIEEYFEN